MFISDDRLSSLVATGSLIERTHLSEPRLGSSDSSGLVSASTFAGSTVAALGTTLGGGGGTPLSAVLVSDHGHLHEPDPLYAQFRDQTRFWIQRVAVPLLMVVGLFGNSITMIIMTRRRMRSTTNLYLAALAFVDIFYLLLTFLLGLSHYPNMAEQSYYLYWRLRPFLMMLTDACSNTSVWLTVTFTIERYIAVKYPIKGKLWCTEARAKMLIVCVATFGLLAASPVPFEWQVVEVGVRRSTTQHGPDNGTSSRPLSGNSISGYAMAISFNDTNNNNNINSTTVYSSNNNDKNHNSHQQHQHQHQRLTLKSTDFGRNETYKTIYYRSTAIIFCFIPLLLLMLFNGFLIKSVHQSRRQRSLMTAVNSCATLRLSGSLPKSKSLTQQQQQQQQQLQVSPSSQMIGGGGPASHPVCQGQTPDRLNRRTRDLLQVASGGGRSWARRIRFGWRREVNLMASKRPANPTGRDGKLTTPIKSNLGPSFDGQPTRSEINANTSSPDRVSSTPEMGAPSDRQPNGSDVVQASCDNETPISSSGRPICDSAKLDFNSVLLERKGRGDRPKTQSGSRDRSNRPTERDNLPSASGLFGETSSSCNGNSNSNSSSNSNSESGSESGGKQAGKVDRGEHWGSRGRDPNSAGSIKVAPAPPASTPQAQPQQPQQQQPPQMAVTTSLPATTQQSCSSASSSSSSSSSSHERRITIMLIAVVILFLVCQIPTAAMLLYTSVDDSVPDSNKDALVLAFGNIFNFLMAVNAAGNFVLYSLLSKRYRKTFVILFCCCLRSKPEKSRHSKWTPAISQAKRRSQSNSSRLNNNNLLDLQSARVSSKNNELPNADQTSSVQLAIASSSPSSVTANITNHNNVNSNNNKVLVHHECPPLHLSTSASGSGSAQTRALRVHYEDKLASGERASRGVDAPV